MANLEYLHGHTSADTAFLVNDYPYGFRLRCKIRYWLEYKEGKGFRLVSQTTNPKVRNAVCPTHGVLTAPVNSQRGHDNCPGPVHFESPWNKPKVSTFCNGPAILALDLETNHVTWLNQSFLSMTADNADRILTAWGPHLPLEFIPELERFAKTKRQYERLTAAGMPLNEAAFKAVRSIRPALDLKLELRDAIIKHFDSHEELRFYKPIIEAELERGTIGGLENYLADNFKLTLANFKGGTCEN